MSLRLTIIIVACMILAIVYFFTLISKNRLGYKYGLTWIVVAFVISIISMWPDALTFVAKIMGVATPSNAMFFLGFVFLLMVVFSLSITISKEIDKTRRLTQDLGILRKELHDYQHMMDEKLKDKV